MSFNVGDKVKHDVYGTGTVTHGPFRSDINSPDEWYVVSQGEVSKSAAGRYLTAVPAFAVGDTARTSWTEEDVTVTYGPYRMAVTDFDWYMVRYRDGTEGHAAASDLSLRAAKPPLAVGDKIRILVDDLADANVDAGDVLTVTHVYYDDFSAGGWYFKFSAEGTGWERVASPQADTVTIDGVTYDMSARYEDEDGDAWRLRLVDGVARATTSCALVFPDESSMTLAHAARTYGPLTKVAD